MQKICCTCGTQYPQNYSSNECTICNEERQYVPESGQQWISTDLFKLKHRNKIVALTSYLFEIVVEPSFAIGQRAFFLISASGNILWDCVPLLNDEIFEFINSKGGLKAIAFSHPHYYSNMNDWAKAFDCPIFIHEEDEPYIVDKGVAIKLWHGKELKLWDDIRLINIGGHFKGSSVLLLPNGVMLCGDTMYLSPSKKHFAMMYSYPNRIPLPIKEIIRIKKALDDLDFNAVYGFYSYQNLTENVKEILESSFSRYLE